MADNRRISVDYAIVWVGRATYGKDWISPPTKYEEDLVEEYGRCPELSSIIPGMITYASTEGGFHRRGERPNASRLADEIEQVLHRHRMREKQFRQAIGWLEDHGFDWRAESFSLDEFYKELKKEYPHVHLRSANAGVPQSLNRPPLNAQTALVPALDTNSSTQLAAAVEPVARELRALDRPLAEQKALDRAPDASPATQLPTVELDAVKPPDDAEAGLRRYPRAAPCVAADRFPRYLAATPVAQNANMASAGCKSDLAPAPAARNDRIGL